MPDQVGLFGGPPSEPKRSRLVLGTVDDRHHAWVIHPPRSGLSCSVRVMGRDPDGRWLCHRCDRSGKDETPTVVVFLAADRLPA